MAGQIDAISSAMIETEKEIAGDAWGNEETEALDQTGDRSLEDQGDGLEGQHEPEDEDDADGDDAEGDEESEGEEETEPKEDKTKEPVAPKVDASEVQGRVPAGRLREANERARLVEAERDALKAQLDKATGDSRSVADQLTMLMREVADLKRGPQAAPKVAEAPKAPVRPDIFENPDGVFDYVDKGVNDKITPLQTEIKNMRVENSMAIAHVVHKDAFVSAWGAINKLNPDNPDDRAAVQRIYASPNPGEALVSWHKRSETLALVGDDPGKFIERTKAELRESLLKDPEFKKQMLADLRAEAETGDDGRPRTTTRLPRSLNGHGSNLGASRADARGSDDSDQAVADAAWR
jgi:hypothetical protein